MNDIVEEKDVRTSILITPDNHKFLKGVSEEKKISMNLLINLCVRKIREEKQVIKLT